MFTYQGSECNTCSFTFYGATSEAESQFHGNARSSHYKQKHTEHLWEWNSFPPNLELLSTLRRSIEEWMESWHGRQLGEAAGLWQRSLIKNGLSRGISSKYEGGFKRGKCINLERKKKIFFQWKHIQTKKNKANFFNFKRKPCKKAIISPSLKKKKRKSPATIQAHGELLSVYFTAYRCTNLSVCCLLRRSGNVNGTESGSENESGNGTVCSQREQVNVSETWSETLSGTLSETWTLREIWQRPCPLLMTSSLGCDWRTWSGSWNGCGSWSGSWSGSSFGNESDSCCDSWKKRGHLILLVLFSFTTYGTTEEQIWSDSVGAFGVCKIVKTTHLLLSSKIFSLRPFSSVPSSLEMAFFMSLRDANSTTLY